MKKATFALALITLAQFPTWAQPVATSANVAMNFTAEFYYSEAANFTPGPAGANQTWDFSNLNLLLTGTDHSIPVAGSPFANLFPSANYLYKFVGIGADRYYYHNISSTKYDILSLGLTATTGENYTPNPRTFAVFPYTYGTVFSDSYQAITDAAETTFTATYDAYGTLVLPFGTFQNVIRQKIVKNGQTNYNWFNVQPFYPILQTVLEQNSIGIIKDLTPPLSVDQHSLEKMFAVYPNPTQGEITIEAIDNTGKDIEIEVLDMLGKRLLYKKENGLSNDQVQLNMESFNSGIYLLKITDITSKYTHIQRVIKK